jgi:Mannosyltransferase (PIG-V)
MARPASNRQRLRDYALIAAIALGSRALCLVIGAGAHFGAAIDGRLPTKDLLSLFVRWDAGWYLRIVGTGYDAWSPADQPGATPYAFFPVYPLLIRATVAMTRLEPATAGILISTVLFVLALFLIYEYVRELQLPRETGLAAILLICCAPQSFVFSSVYTESTFLFLLAAAMLALRRRRYLWAGLAAALLSGVRPNGIVFVVFALAWTLRNAGWRPLLRPWTDPGPMLTIVLAPLGMVAFWWYCFMTTGDAFAQATSVTHGWGWAPDWPWENLRRHVRGSSTDRFWAWGSLLYFAASLLLLRFRLYEDFAFCLACFLLFWTNVLPQSLVRYVLVLFPIFIGLARVTADRPLALASLAGGLAALNGFLMVAFALQWRISV